MKKILVFLVFLISTNIAFSQTEKYDEAFKNLKENYNAGNFDAIFNTFSLEMKTALPLESTEQFFKGLSAQAGKIKEGKFLKLENSGYAIFKTDFQNAVFNVAISINDSNLINGFSIKPFIEEQEINIVNGLSDFPENIGSTVFSLSKNFPAGTQLSIAFIKNGKVSYYGIIMQDNIVKPIDNQTSIFEIGSVTKVFTSTVLASLVTDKKLKLNSNINDYYDFNFNNNTKINLLELANHTSGLPRLPENIDLSNATNPYKNYGTEELNEYLLKFLNTNDVNIKKYDYSNLGAGLLGHTLGISQKKSFSDLLKEDIFIKYEMNNSFTSLDQVSEKLVKGLNEKGQEISNWEFDVLFGGGGILSTSEDLVKFAKAQFDPKNNELELTRKPTFDINEQMKIGLGWHVLKTEQGFNWIWHNGGTAGYSSSIVLDVAKKNGIIILSNVSAFHPQMGNIDKLCFELMKMTEK